MCRKSNTAISKGVTKDRCCRLEKEVVSTLIVAGDQAAQPDGMENRT